MSETKSWAIALVFLCTFVTSAAQIFLKFGSKTLKFDLISMITNYNLIAGICLYGVGAVLLIIAFFGGEVTVIYPIFATSYIWVLFLSYWFLGESLNVAKIAAIVLIIIGIFFVTRTTKLVKYVDVV